MNAAACISAVVDALGLPANARVDIRVPKKMLIEQGAPTSTDRRAIQDGIDELLWFAACKPGTVGVPTFADEVREYVEIAVIGCAFRAGAKTSRLIELVHRAIPYPVVLVTADDQGIDVSVAHKRRAQNEAAKVVVDRDASTRLRSRVTLLRDFATRMGTPESNIPNSESSVQISESKILR